MEVKMETKRFPMDDYDLAMKTRWYVSKNHPLNYQKRVLQNVKQPVAGDVVAAKP